MNDQNFFQSDGFRKILYGVGIVIAVLLIFQAGMQVGFRKASFSYGFSDNYHRAFGRQDRHMGMVGFLGGNDFINSGGAMGKIININLPTLAIENTDGIEKAVLITDNTIIKRFRETIKENDLKMGDFVVVIGSPNNDSQIEARIVRIMPNPANFIGTSTKAGFKNY